MLHILIHKNSTYSRINTQMVLAICKSKLSDTSTPSKSKRRLRKLSAKDIIEEAEEDDTNDDSLKENQKKIP